MVQKSGEHQLRLVVHPIIDNVLAPSFRWLINRRISEPSKVCAAQVTKKNRFLVGGFNPFEKY